MITGRPVSLYLHFPFCVRKCRYCDFLSFPAQEEVRERYISRLLKEIAVRGEELRGRQVPTIFIGGGTPSLMTAGQLSQVMEALYRHFDIAADAEISMECNPGTVGGGACVRKGTSAADCSGQMTFTDIKKCGINRLSLGLQSADNVQLAILGRIHTWEQFLASFEAAREAGFTNINVDLMSGLPGQSCASWMKTLQEAVRLEPEHISAYSLILEEGTPFWDIYSMDDPVSEREHIAEKAPIETSGDGACREALIQTEGDGEYRKSLYPHALYPPLPDEEEERQMYEDTVDYLAEKGYLHYEISNYARPGFACRHNLTYWYRRDYLGLGLGAASLVDERRFSVTSDLSEYLRTDQKPYTAVDSDGAQPGSFLCRKISLMPILSRKEQMEETMFLGLRCAAGVDKQGFRERFGKEMAEVYGEVIHKYVSYGFMREDNEKVCLTRKGISISNQILADFLL